MDGWSDGLAEVAHSLNFKMEKKEKTQRWRKMEGGGGEAFCLGRDVTGKLKEAGRCHSAQNLPPKDIFSHSVVTKDEEKEGIKRTFNYPTLICQTH